MPPPISVGERMANLAHRATASTLMLISAAGMVYLTGAGVEIFGKWRAFKAEKKARALAAAADANAS